MTRSEKARSLGLALIALGGGLLAAKVRRLGARPDLEGLGTRTSCKEVVRPEQAAGCLAIELDLSATRDGVWVLSHEPLLGDRRLLEHDYEAVAGELSSLPDLNAWLELEKARLELVDLDLKDHFMGPARFAALLEKNLPHVEELSERSRIVVLTTPVPWKYALLHRFIARRGLASKGIFPGLEVVDYDASQADGWGLPLSRAGRLLLPVARLGSRLYARLNDGRIPFLVVQERTAAAWSPPPESPFLCWTRDPARGRPPGACALTERARRRTARDRRGR